MLYLWFNQLFRIRRSYQIGDIPAERTHPADQVQSLVYWWNQKQNWWHLSVDSMLIFTEAGERSESFSTMDQSVLLPSPPRKSEYQPTLPTLRTQLWTTPHQGTLQNGQSYQEQRQSKIHIITSFRLDPWDKCLHLKAEHRRNHWEANEISGRVATTECFWAEAFVEQKISILAVKSRRKWLRSSRIRVEEYQD